LPKRTEAEDATIKKIVE
jgi:hypothetical protein